MDFSKGMFIGKAVVFVWKDGVHYFKWVLSE